MRANSPPSATHEALRQERKWLQELVAETDALNATERYQAWLAVTANLRHYSPLNCCLILMQARRGVAGVASASEWRRRGRTLKEGASPISVLAPTGARRYMFVEVFDLRDTEGPPLPKLDSYLLTGGAELLPRVEAAAGPLGITVRNRRHPHAWGRCLPNKVVHLQPGLPRATRMATLLHEYAHALLGHAEVVPPPRLSKEVEECEAEGVAWVVSRALGVESKAPEYLAAWGFDVRTLQASTRRIGTTARAILAAIQGRGPRRRVARAA